MKAMQQRLCSVLPALLGLALAACTPATQTRTSNENLRSDALASERSLLEQRLREAGSQTSPDLRLQRDYAWSLLVQGEQARAEALLQQIDARENSDLRTLLGLGLCAQERGDHRQAQDLWLRLLSAHIDQAKPTASGAFAVPSEPWADAMAELAAHRLLVLGADGSGPDAERRLRERVLSLWQQRHKLPLEAQQLVAALAGQLLRLAGEEPAAQRLDIERGCPATFFLSSLQGQLPALDLLSPFPSDDPARDPQRTTYRRRSGYGCSVTVEGASGRPGVVAAVTWAEARGAGPHPLSIESGGSPYALYVDGRLSHIEQNPQRRRHLWLNAAAGWHTLVLKVGTLGNAQVQLSAPTLTFFTGDLQKPPALPPANTVLTRRRPLADTPLAGSGWESVLRSLLRAQQAHITGDFEPGLDAVEQALSVAPRFSVLAMLKAALLLDDRTRPERLMRDQARNLLEQVLSAHPTHLRARLSLATLLLQDDHADQAQDLLEATPQGLSAVRQKSYQVQLLYYRVLKARGWQLESERALEEALKLAPSGCSVLEAAVDLRRERGDVRGALDAARRLRACNPYSDRLADELHDAGQVKEAEAEYVRLLQLEPENEEWQSALARLWQARRGPGDLQRALGLRQALTGRSPRNINHRVDLANLQIELGQREAALATLRAGQELVPESAELQRALLALGDPGLMDAYRIDGKQVIGAFMKSSAAETFGGEPAVMLLDRTVVRVLPNAARLTLTHNIIRVLTKDGLGKFGEVRIPDGAEVLTLRTIKADGSTREPESIPEKDTVSAPDLEVGDFVEFEYIDRDPPIAGFPRAFLAERFYFASTDAPLDRSEYVLVVPTDLPLQIDVRGPAQSSAESAPPATVRDVPVANVRTQGELRIHTWQRSHVPRLRPEPPLSEAVIDEWMPSVRVGGGLSFAHYVNFLRERRVRTLHIGRDVRAQALALVGPPLRDGDLESGAPTGNSDPLLQIVRRALRLDAWVRKSIREGSGGSIDEQATSILARREGRRDTLLLALLQAAGIPCELWLVRPKNAPQLEGPLPDLTAYSEVVIAVAPGRGPGGQPLLFLEPSLRHTTSGYVRPMLRGAKALRVPEPPSSPRLPSASFADVQLPEDGGVPAAWRRGDLLADRDLMARQAVLTDGRRLDMTLTLAADGSPAGEVTVREQLTGASAIEWREHAENQSQDKLRQELEQRALGFFFPGASLLDLKYGPIENDDEPLIVEYRFQAPQLARKRVEKGAQELVLPAPFPSLFSRTYVRVASRSTPLFVHPVAPTVLSATYVLPPRLRVAQLAAPVEVRDFGRFTQRATASDSGDRITLQIELSVPLARIAPDRFPAFVDFARRIDSAEAGFALLSVAP
ncbi:MAG: tetratricopeptide repeat protein [Myxococcales bacterium]|nr:tetratricopeptide repeat protein [Myxococcales bacterium]